MVTTSLHEAIEHIFTGQYKNSIFLYLIELFFYHILYIIYFLKIYFLYIIIKIYINKSNKIIIKLKINKKILYKIFFMFDRQISICYYILYNSLHIKY